MTAFPVSVKGVVIRDDRVLLLRNDREEWELPGGRLEPGETPQQCVTREITEETGWQVRVGPLLDVWVYQPLPGREVVIVTYGCHLVSGGEPVRSAEHEDVALVPVDQVTDMTMPTGYALSIASWWAVGGRGGS